MKWCIVALVLWTAAERPSAAAPASPQVQTRESQAAMTPSTALDALKAGNVVNDDELGSLEYAVSVGTKVIVVLGHTGCGAVKGAMGDVQLGNLTGLLAKIHPAVRTAHCSSPKDETCDTKVAEQNVRQSLKEIRDGSPYLAKHLDEGKIGLVGAMYDVTTGRVTFLDD